MAYTLTGKKGGTVRFVPNDTGVVEKESESYSSSITSNPIEDGADLNDHVNNAMGQLSISGTIVGGERAINALKAMRESRDILTYIGVTRMAGLVITSLKFDRSYKNRNGASFSATLKQVRTSSSEYVSMDGVETMTSQDNGKSDNAQLAVTKNAGQTVVAYQTVSAASVQKREAAYAGDSSSAPLTRRTGGYDGVTATVR